MGGGDVPCLFYDAKMKTVRRCAVGLVGDEWGVATMPFFTYDAKMKTVCMCALGSVGDEWEVGIHAVGVS